MVYTGEINYDFYRRMLRAGALTKPLVLASAGGDTSAARALYDWLAGVRPTIIATGEIASAALPVFAAGGHRFCTESTVFLWHEPYAEGLDPTMGRDLMAMYTASMSLWYNWACERLSANSKLTYKQWRALGRGAGEEFSADDALRWGLAEAVVTPQDFADVLALPADAATQPESESADEKDPDS